MEPVLGVLQWEPQVRGALILLTGLLILAGSVFVILSTNIGTRVGFLVAATGLFGWLSLLTLLWTVTPSATGPKGREPRWKVEAVVAGDELPTTAKPPLDRFPQGWKKLEEGEKELAEAQATVEETLDEESDTGKELGFGEETPQGTREPEVKAGYSKGGETYFLTLLHKPHFAAIQVEPVLKPEPVPGQPVPEPTEDPDKPLVTVLMVRDLGTRRLPPLFGFVGTFTIFCVLVSILHRRDKQAMAARAGIEAGGG